MLLTANGTAWEAATSRWTQLVQNLYGARHDKMGARILGSQAHCTYVSSNPPSVLTMTSETKRPEGQDGTLSRLNVAIDTLNLAKDVCCIAPAQAAFGAASGLLTMIRVHGL